MKHHYIRMIVTLVGLLYLCSVSYVIGQESLKIATFNCEFLVKNNVHKKFGYPLILKNSDKTEWEKPGYRDTKFKEAITVVAEVIKEINADVISLIEVGKEEDVEQLRQEVGLLGVDYPHSTVCKSSDYTTKQQVAIFSKRPIVVHSKIIAGREGYDQEFDDPESEKDTGISKGMHISFTVADQVINMFIVHLASERGGHEQDAQRVAQASIIRRNYLEYLNKGEHVIVAGDLNDHRGQPALRRIRGKDDIYGDLIQTGLSNYFPKDKLDSRWTYQFKGERRQIDHILISQSIKRACKRGGIKSEVIPVSNKMASDHRAFVVTLEFN